VKEAIQNMILRYSRNCRIIIIVCAAVTTIYATGLYGEIRWTGESSINEKKREKVEKRVTELLIMSGIETNQAGIINILPSRLWKNEGCEVYEAVSDNRTYEIDLCYPGIENVKMIADWKTNARAEQEGYLRIKKAFESRRKDPSGDYPIKTNYSEEEAAMKAQNLLESLENRDLTNWKCIRGIYMNGKWIFQYAPFFMGYRLRIATISIDLSDIDNLKLCSYLSVCRQLPEMKQMPVMIAKGKAEEMAYLYIKKNRRRTDSIAPGDWYRKPNGGGEIAEGKEKGDYKVLRSELSYIYPNYIYTERYSKNMVDTDNEPRWAWMVYLLDYPQGLGKSAEQLPVAVYIDAVSGECVGGGE
jgi:hypothetical protein